MYEPFKTSDIYTNHSRSTDESWEDVIMPEHKKKGFTVRRLSTSEQFNDSDRNITHTDCSDSFAMSVGC